MAQLSAVTANNLGCLKLRQDPHAALPHLIASLQACTINRPCAQQFVGKYQSCMVTSGRLIVHAPDRLPAGAAGQHPAWLPPRPRDPAVQQGGHGWVRCAQQYVGKSQSCMVVSGDGWVRFHRGAGDSRALAAPGADSQSAAAARRHGRDGR